MTRNLYLGGDITRPLDATSGLSGVPALLAFGRANNTLAGIVDATDFPARSTALAREIADNEPDVVGLQEVALWRHGPLQLDQIGTANAETVDYDFLATLTDDLAALGADYRVAEVQVESDVEGPAFAAVPGRPDLPGRATDHARRAAGQGRPGQGRGARQRAVPDPDLVLDRRRAVPFIRGYTWADIRVGTKRLRVVNTHLESQSSLRRQRHRRPSCWPARAR